MHLTARMSVPMSNTIGFRRTHIAHLAPCEMPVRGIMAIRGGRAHTLGHECFGSMPLRRGGEPRSISHKPGDVELTSRGEVGY